VPLVIPLRRIHGTPALFAALLLTACSPPVTPGSGIASSTVAEPSDEPASGSPSASGPAELPVVHEGGSVPITAGSYVTGRDGFFPGLSLTVPAGWIATETDDGELALHPADHPNDFLFMWKDLAAVVTNNRSQTVGQPLPDVGQTEPALIAWLTTTADFTVLVAPEQVTIGQAITGTQLTLDVSDTANFGWDDCPDNPRCAAIFTDPIHWGANFYAIGGDEVARIFMATVSYPDGDHVFFVTLDAPNQGELARLAADAEPIIASLQLPLVYTAN
jgi:hypothetical protein